MSYCRWSTDDYQCDVYVYEDSRGGWTTHVASRRPVFVAPLPPLVELTHPFTDEQFDEWWKRHKTVQSMLDDATYIDLNLPHDGETFNDDTSGECADRLAELSSLGYNVPPSAIDELREEQVEATPSTSDPDGSEAR